MNSSIEFGPTRAKRQHWSQLDERGAYFGLRITLSIYRIFGRRSISLILYPIIAYFYLASTTARQASCDFLNRVFAQPLGREVLERRPGWQSSFRHMYCFGEAILDKLAAWSGDIALDQLDFDNEEVFRALREQGQGAVLVASHLGNIDLCRALGSLQHGIRINVLAHTKHSEAFNRVMREVEASSTISLIQVTDIGPDTAIMLRDRLGMGEFVVIVGDRTPAGQSSRVSWVPFLGHPAPFPQGPFHLAAMLRCPILLIFCLKRDGRYHVVFEEFADATSLSRRERSRIIKKWIARYAGRLEELCVLYPYQWFNFFDFWSQASPAAVSSQPNTQ